MEEHLVGRMAMLDVKEIDRCCRCGEHRATHTATLSTQRGGEETKLLCGRCVDEAIRDFHLHF